MQELWQKNKKLMIQALAAMMVFLLISTYARSVRGDHEKDHVRHKRKAPELSHKLQEYHCVCTLEEIIAYKFDDILGAGRIGIKTVWVNRFNEPLKNFPIQPTYIVSNISELENILKDL